MTKPLITDEQIADIAHTHSRSLAVQREAARVRMEHALKELRTPYEAERKYWRDEFLATINDAALGQIRAEIDHIRERVERMEGSRRRRVWWTIFSRDGE